MHYPWRRTTRSLHIMGKVKRRSKKKSVAQAPPGGYLVSVQGLARLRGLGKEAGMNLDRLQRYSPIGRIGYSMYVFKF